MLDLDETLVHCTVDPIVNPDHSFEVHFNGEEFQVTKLPLFSSAAPICANRITRAQRLAALGIVEVRFSKLLEDRVF